MFECTWPGDSARGTRLSHGSSVSPPHFQQSQQDSFASMMSGTRMDATFNWSCANQQKKTLEKWAWIMPHDARISRDSLCHGECMEGVGKTWEVARESADGDYCHFDYLTVEDEDDNDVDDDDDDWGLACVRSPLRFSQFFVKRRRLGFFNNAQPWRVDGIWWAEWSLVRISENQ